MSAIITNKLRIFNAQQFIESIRLNVPQWGSGNYEEGDMRLSSKRLYIAVDVANMNSTLQPTHSSGVVNGWLYHSQSHYNNVYMGIGKSEEWYDDSNPPTPDDSVGGGFDIISNLTALKKINPDSITLSCPRIDWVEGTPYEMYDHNRSESIIPNGYVLVPTDNQYSVYKCLNNSKYTSVSDGVSITKSTIKPSGQSLDAPSEPTDDGYVWKYMYSIHMLDAIDFLTKDYMPVKYIPTEPSSGNVSDANQWTIKQNASTSDNSGRIDWVRIVPDDGVTDPDLSNTSHAGGDGYLPNIVVTSVTTAVKTVLQTVTGSITGINNTGTFNYTGYSIYMKGGGDSGAFRMLKSGSNLTGAVFTFVIESAFTANEVSGATNIIIAPEVRVTGNGENFSAYARTSNLNSGQIDFIEILNKGKNYTNATGTIFLGTGVVGIPTIPCLIRPIISPIHGHGFNAVEELGAYYGMVSLKLSYDESSTRNIDDISTKTVSFFPVAGNESVFRQVSIISDPVDNFSKSIISEETYRGPNHPDYGTVGELSLDISSGVGKILYIENRQPVSRAIDQIEDIKVVFEF